ncbi:MAG: error-prone DNA polymerase [Bryobacteraceae bacterium]|nr:error-prone DNA polymerase [Bryobacteraceae bacterium]
MKQDYVELHAKSAFSFLRGASQPEQLVEIAANLDQSGIAVLDRDGFYGSVRQHLAAKKLGLKAHVGAEITCTDGAVYPLLCESRSGYQNLSRLITRIKLRTTKEEATEGKAAATPEELAEYSEGLVCLAGAEGGPTMESAVLIYGAKHTYAELNRHLRRDQEARNQHNVELARRLQVPLLATNAPTAALPEQRQILDVFTCIRNHTSIAEAGRLLSMNSERHLKSSAIMAKRFSDYPESIINTLELSARLDYSMDGLGYEFPAYPVPDGETMNSFLRKRTWEGVASRYRTVTERVRQQVEKELELIGRLRLDGYFLIVWDIVRFCQANDILAQGRGSAANSAVCYSLGITAVDPVGMELLFERFLSEERGEWPDIDIDLPSGARRERVIQHVYQLYGKLGAAMTANVICYRGRSAAREIGKVLGFDEESTARLSSMVHSWEWKDPADTPEGNFAQAGFDLSDPRVRKFFELYLAVQDLPRHLGQHSGGMVICQGRLDSVVPLEPASMPDRVVVQWDKDDCADMGILKIDLLGLGMMAVIEDTLKLIPRHYGHEVDLAQIPAGDKKVYHALQTADTIGWFQVESRAQQAMLPRVKPEHFYDIVVQVGIIRPGPIVGKMVNPYIQRRLGLQKPDYMHPSLEPVLKRTLGVPLFQEQLLRIAMIAAGFSGGAAEELRRAFGSKRSEKRMREVELKLRAGMERNGITGSAQDAICHSITSFALYGFPESHAASFALLAYASGYLKCHYLAAFTAAMLNNQPMGFYHPASLVKDAQRHGLRVLPVDIQISNWLCTVDAKMNLRLGFRYVRGLREEAGQGIENARVEGGPFVNIEDLIRRVPALRKDELRMLARVGGLNTIGTQKRRDALWNVERARRSPGPLFAGLPDAELPSPLSQMDVRERLHADFFGTGLTVGRHPMSYYRPEMNERGVVPASALPHMRDGSVVRVAGAIIVRQRPGTAHGFLFLSLEDETGISNIIVQPDMYERERANLTQYPFVIIHGVLQNLQGSLSVKAGRVEPFDVNAIPVPSHDFH